MKQRQSLEQIFESHIRLLATTLRPGTVVQYRSCARLFLAYLRGSFPQLDKLSQLRRDPHLIGWARSLCEQDPPLHSGTRLRYLVFLRRLFHDLADYGHPLFPDLILPQDLPPRDHHLPNPLSPEDDLRLDRELRKTDDLGSNALLLMRATGIRIGECIDLSVDCLRQISKNQWALHVPLGKLHTERWVPVDHNTRCIVTRILALRAHSAATRLPQSQGFLLPRRGQRYAWRRTLALALAQAARRARCTTHVNPHRLRHTFATTMLRLGVSLPALMQLLGHKDIRMTLLYLQVTQQDLQREFYRAHQMAAQLHPIPKLSVPLTQTTRRADLSTIFDAITATRHLLDIFRRRLQPSQASRTLRRLSRRLLNIRHELQHLPTTEK